MATYLAFQSGDDRILVEVETVPAYPAQQDDGKAGLRRRDSVDDDGKAGIAVEGAIRSTIIDVERRLSDAFAMVRSNAKAFMDEISALDIKPSEIEMKFGLKASGELGNFVVGKVTGDANYEVKMVWKK